MATPASNAPDVVPGAETGSVSAPVFTVTRTSVQTRVELSVEISGMEPMGWSRGEMIPQRARVSYRDDHDGDGWDAQATVSGRHVRKDGNLGQDASTYVWSSNRKTPEQQALAEPENAELLRWMHANRPPVYRPTEGQERDVLAALYAAADGNDAATAMLDEVSENAGLIWACPECRWRHRLADGQPDRCEECRHPRLTETAATGPAGARS